MNIIHVADNAPYSVIYYYYNGQICSKEVENDCLKWFFNDMLAATVRTATYAELIQYLAHNAGEPDSGYIDYLIEYSEYDFKFIPYMSEEEKRQIILV